MLTEPPGRLLRLTLYEDLQCVRASWETQGCQVVKNVVCAHLFILMLKKQNAMIREKYNGFCQEHSLELNARLTWIRTKGARGAGVVNRKRKGLRRAEFRFFCVGNKT